MKTTDFLTLQLDEKAIALGFAFMLISFTALVLFERKSDKAGK